MTASFRVLRRRTTGLRRAAPILVVVAAIVGLSCFGWFGFVTPAAAEIHAPASLPTSISVTAKNPFQFVVSNNNEVAANATIQVTFTNSDTIPHTFSLSSIQGVAIPNIHDGSNVNSAGWTDATGALHPWTINVYLNQTGSTTFNLTAPAMGWYEFVCSEPGHFNEGMLSAIGFGVPAPSNLTGPTALVQVGWPVYVIAGTIVGLVVLALVLGFASGQRHGARQEMPPERLGYPEPVNPPVPGTPPLPRGTNSPSSGPPQPPNR
ncbi:MAG: plastocyanin/azurin family copper-binding protein [Thermoplasmata archaeon]